MNDLKEAAALLGAKGGAAGRGAAKRRDVEVCARGGKLRWAGVAAEERSKTMKAVRSKKGVKP